MRTKPESYRFATFWLRSSEAKDSSFFIHIGHDICQFPSILYLNHALPYVKYCGRAKILRENNSYIERNYNKCWRGCGENGALLHCCCVYIYFQCVCVCVCVYIYTHTYIYIYKHMCV